MDNQYVIFKDVNIATFASNNDYGIVHDGAIVTEDDTIRWVGPQKDIPEQYQPADKTKSFHGLWLTPGFIDSHTHLIYGGKRWQEFEQRIQGVSYTDISQQGGGIQSTVKATRKATEKSLYLDALRRVISLQREGVTTVEIKSGYGLNLETEAKMLSVAKQLEDTTSMTVIKTFLGAHALPAEFNSHSEYIHEICQHMLPSLKEKGLVDHIDAFCEKIAFSPEDLKELFAVAQSMGIPIKCHAEQLSQFGGTQLACQFKALSVDHLEYANEEDFLAMAASGTVAVLLPGAFYFLRETQKPNIERLRQLKIPMAVATDSNPGTSPTTSILLMMNMAAIFFGLTPLECLQGVTKNAAKALGLASEIGTIEVGKKADFAVWDIDHPAELVAQFGYHPCVGIIKNGKVKNGVI